MAIPVEQPTFMRLSMSAWVKILLGWLTASLIGIGGWFLHIRDGFAERYTRSQTDQKFSETKFENTKVHYELERDVEQVNEDIHSIEVWQAAHIEIEHSQTEQMKALAETLKDIQSDLKKIRWNNDQ